MKNIIIIAFVLSVIISNLYSQHDHNTMDHGKMNHSDSNMVVDSTINADTNKTQHKHQHDINENKIDDNESNEHTGHNMESDIPMSHSYSLSLPMNRNGSGTGWLPDESPMNGYMLHSGKWMMMFHGSVFLRYTSTDITKEGTKGLSKWDAPNWLMGMAQRKVGSNGLLKFGLMLSLDRLTEGGDGYPLLYQSGETWEGKPLVNRQHPHDLFAELSVGYTQRLNKDIDITGYFGYPGEPALGPVAFMHRVSSSNNPDAPLSHHWQDASHITFGVGTLGLRYKIFRLEGSVFTGSEPDEERWGFDKMNLNSYSYRLSVNPTKNFALQFSQGFIKSPEALEPGVDVTRTTTSVIHSHNFSSTRNINTTFAWGYNDKGHGHTEHSFLLESNLQINKLALYGRYEFVQKDSDELSLEGFKHDAKFNINAITLGTNYRIFQFSNTNVSLGIQGSMYFSPKELQPIYGKNPLSAQIYIKLNPADM
ncbi:MAG: hypothetical protein HOP31_03915 [Ignavibacteria bacterium]|nr:hypothetical protein [Ignavibacteria bacterium]